MKMLNRLRKDKKGIVWIYIVIIMSMFVYSLIWFVTGYALFEAIDIAEANFTVTGSIVFAAEFIKTVVRYHPILVFIGLMLWGYVNSQRRATY